MFGDGLLPFVLAERSGDPVVVLHHGVPDASTRTFEFAYVGTGASCLQPTPWSHPSGGQGQLAMTALTTYLTVPFAITVWH